MNNTLNFYDEPLKGRIISSGITMPVKKILEDGRVLLDGMGEPLGPDEVELIDNIDYDSYRPQFAGQIFTQMLAIIPDQMMHDQNFYLQIMKQMKEEGYSCIEQIAAEDSVRYADMLITALKKPRKLNPLDFRAKVKRRKNNETRNTF